MKKKIIVYSISFLVLVFSAIMFGYSYGDLIISFLRNTQGTKRSLLSEGGDSGKEIFSASLYFGSSEKNVLVKYPAKIPKGKNDVESIRNLVNALIKGPKGDGFVRTMPKETKLRSIFKGEDGVLYLDFSRSISENHPGGAWAEIITLNSLAYSISKNFGKKIDRIVLLIEGQEAITLSGTVSMLGSLTMKKDLISEREIINLDTTVFPTRRIRDGFSTKKKVSPAGLPDKSLEKSMRIKEDINPVGTPYKKP
ncbi:MAG: GerMN domain-containing protein [Nitrospinota bacterium]|nr:GerMN domain-containing protein [Nitrospinota bacterium]